MNADKTTLYEFAGFRLDMRRRLLLRDGARVPLAGKSFDALVHLVEHAGEVVTRTALTEALWPSTVVEENNLTQAIATLRRTLGEDSIATVARRGYQFTLEVRKRAPDPASTGTAAPTPAPAVPQRSRRSMILAGAAVTALAAAAWLSWRLWPEAAGAGDPIAGHHFSKLTEFEGSEEHAAISRDGRYVAFLRERDGQWDVWVGEIGTGAFRNLTEGKFRELRNPAVRTLGFLPDGSHVAVWTRSSSVGGIVDAGLAFPTIGGPPQVYRQGAAELDWSPDGRSVAYHTPAEGDPLFVAQSGARDEGRSIHRAPSGMHIHFPTWSRDGSFIYFVRGFVPDEMDLWRIRPDGSELEQVTTLESRVSFPTAMNESTILYLATDEAGSGPWIHALDTRQLRSRRIDTRGQEYTSLAASSDGRRIVATEFRRSASLWRMPLRPGGRNGSDARRLEIPTPRGDSPRFGPGFILYRASNAGSDGLWRMTDGTATELWRGVGGRLVAAPAISLDGRRIALTVRRQGRTQLLVMDAGGGDVRLLSGQLEVRGSPAWSPDGRWIAVGALEGGGIRLFRIPAGGGEAVLLADEFATHPAWSPSGRFLVYAGADIGTNFQVRAVNADATPHEIPPITLSRGAGRFKFLSEHELVVLKGDLTRKSLWMVDLRDGSERPLATFEAGPSIQDFDVAADRSEVVFDRVSMESDIVLIERQPP